MFFGHPQCNAGLSLCVGGGGGVIVSSKQTAFVGIFQWVVTWDCHSVLAFNALLHWHFLATHVVHSTLLCT